MHYVIIETSPGRFGYQIVGACGTGGGYMSRGEAEIAAVRAINLHRQREQPASLSAHFDAIS